MKLIGQGNFKLALTCLLKPTLTVFAVLLFTSVSFAQNNSINLIQNPGFENKFSGWQEIEPVKESDNVHSGTLSAKITGATGILSQAIEVVPNTDYVFSGHIKGFGRIGVKIGGEKIEKRINGTSDWTKAEVAFNSGSSSLVEVYANFYREQGRYDDFSLAPKYAIAKAAASLLTQCPSIGYLPIAVAYDDDSNDGNNAENVTDGDLSNRWSSKGMGKTITFDLDLLAEVSQIEVMWYKGAERISLFSVETSMNGRNWKKVLPDASSTPTDGFETYNIENLLDPEARMVRIIGNGNSINDWNSILEVKIKGCVN